MSTPDPGGYVRVEDAGQREYLIPNVALRVLLDSFPGMSVTRKPVRDSAEGADS